MKRITAKLSGWFSAIWQRAEAKFSGLSLSKKIGLFLALIGLFFLIRTVLRSFRTGTQNTEGVPVAGPGWAPIVKPVMVMRNDSLGSGEYGASRGGGSRDHAGIDIEVFAGQTIYAPFAGTFTRTYNAYSNDSRYKGLEIVSESGYKIKIMYCRAFDRLVGYHVSQGQAIATAQSIKEKYSPKMQDHIHVEVYYLGVRIDPTQKIQLQN